jgi:hypothetical protein
MTILAPPLRCRSDDLAIAALIGGKEQPWLSVDPVVSKFEGQVD